jgi:Tfp pilus assembly protein PilO
VNRGTLRLASIALVCAGLPLGIYLLGMRPAELERLKQSEVRLEAETADLRALTITANRLEEFKAARADRDEKLKLLEQIRPREPQVEPALDRLRAIAMEYGLTVLEAQALPAGEAAAPLELRLRGEHPGIVSFIRRLPRLARLIRLDRVEMERLSGPQFELRLRVTVFYWKG